MAARRLATASTKRVWLGDKGVYPIIGIITAGCTFATYRGLRHSLSDPASLWSQSARTTPTFMRDNFDEGRRYRERTEAAMVKNSVDNLRHNAPPIFRPLYALWKE